MSPDGVFVKRGRHKFVGANMKTIVKIAMSVLLVSVSACSANRAGSGAGENTLGYSDDDMLMGQEISELGTVHFEFDSADLSSDAKATLKNNSAWFAKNQSKVVTVEGHCDKRGTTEYNLALGERRAQSTVEYLTALGVPTQQVRTISFGAERPLVEGSSEEAYSQNRRAAFTSGR